MEKSQVVASLEETTAATILDAMAPVPFVAMAPSPAATRLDTTTMGITTASPGSTTATLTLPVTLWTIMTLRRPWMERIPHC